MATPFMIFAALLPTASTALRLNGQPKSSPGVPETPVPSQGCSAADEFSAGTWRSQSLPMDEEPGLPPVNRQYSIYVPKSYDPTVPSPLLMLFHGWNDDALAYRKQYNLDALADREGMVVVYPIGMDDCSHPDCKGFVSWNGGGTTESSASKMTCDLSVQKQNFCYDSCVARKGSCHRCDWTSCYDDVGFIQELVVQLGRQHCIDRRRVFGYGCSNGGMFLHHFLRTKPGIFAGIVSGCGAKPHLGWEGGLKEGGPPVSVAILTGRSDQTIPLDGNASGQHGWDGYFYADTSRLVQVYRHYSKCTNTERRRYGAGFNARRMACWEEGFDCAGGSSVTTCTFLGGHAVNEGVGEDDTVDEFQFAAKFLKQHPLSPEYLAGCDVATSPPHRLAG